MFHLVRITIYLHLNGISFNVVRQRCNGKSITLAIVRNLVRAYWLKFQKIVRKPLLDWPTQKALALGDIIQGFNLIAITHFMANIHKLCVSVRECVRLCLIVICAFLPFIKSATAK